MLRFVPFELAIADALVPMWREAFENGVGIVDRRPAGSRVRRVVLNETGGSPCAA